MTHKALFHIDLDAFFASVQQLLHPELRGHPVIVKGPGRHRTVVAAASYEARPYGVTAGMPTAQAKRCCPHAVFVTGQGRVYADFSEKIFAICRQFTPLVEPASIDEGYLDLTGTARLYGHRDHDPYWPIQVAQTLKHTVKQQLGLNCSIGIGTNKLIAKIASDLAKPNGIAYIWPGYERRFLKPLPVKKLPGIGAKSLPCLNALGVKTVGDLQNTPVNVLTGIFGVVGEDFYHLAHGIADDTISEPVDPKSVSRGTTFDRDTRDVTFIKHTLRHLVADLAAHLRRLDFWAKRITVTIRYHDFTTVGRQGFLDDLTNYDHDIIAKAARLFDHLYQWPKPLRAICVGVSRLTQHPTCQLELWPTRRPERKKYHAIYTTIDKLQAKYGKHAIRFAQDIDPNPPAGPSCDDSVMSPHKAATGGRCPHTHPIAGPFDSSTLIP